MKKKAKTTRKTTAPKKAALRDLTTLEGRSTRVKAGARAAKRPARF